MPHPTLELPPGVLEAIAKQAAQEVRMQLAREHSNGHVKVGKFTMTFERGMHMLSALGMVVLLAFNFGGDWREQRKDSTQLQSDVTKVEQRVSAHDTTLMTLDSKVNDIKREQEQQRSLLMQILDATLRRSR